MAKSKKTKTDRIEYWQKDRQLERLTKYKMQGYTNERIAKMIGISVKTLHNWINKDPTIKEAINLGRDLLHEERVNSVMDLAFDRMSEPQTTKEVLNRRYNTKTQEWEDVSEQTTTTVASYADQIDAQLKVMKYIKPAVTKSELEVTGEGFKAGSFTMEQLIAMANLDLDGDDDGEN